LTDSIGSGVDIWHQVEYYRSKRIQVLSVGLCLTLARSATFPLQVPNMPRETVVKVIVVLGDADVSWTRCNMLCS